MKMTRMIFYRLYKHDLYRKGIPTIKKSFREVKKYFNNKVYKTVIPRNVKLSEAPSYGMPICMYDARSKGSRCYDKFAKEFIKKNEIPKN